MQKSVFLDSSVLEKKPVYEAQALEVKQDRIRFEFPTGFTQLRLIEECRALNCLDVSDPDNFDFMYDITMQMLVGKSVFIYFIDDRGTKQEVERFLVTDRYMNLRGVDFIDEYPEKYGFKLMGTSASCKCDVLVNKEEKILMIQGHPEYFSPFNYK